MGMDEDEEKTVVQVVFISVDGTETNGPTIVISRGKENNNRV
jgi:hypothetical protein